MAVFTTSDAQIFEAQFHGSFVEVSQQNSALFNEGSNGAIRLVPERHRGNFQEESLFTDTANLVKRRDPTTDGNATALKLAQDEMVRVKLDRRIGPVDTMKDAMRKIQQDPGRAGQIVGRQAAKQVAEEQLNNAIAAFVAATETNSLDFDATDGTPQTTDLTGALKLFGDAQGEIVAWVMHSNSFFDLLDNQITSSGSPEVENVAGFAVANGSPVTLGRPTFMTDSASLIESGGVSTGVDEYRILGLTQDALQILESQAQDVVVDDVTGDDNLKIRYQAEYAYSLGIRGYKWDITNGGVNPTDANVATGTNWDTWVSDNKLTGGVMVRSR